MPDDPSQRPAPTAEPAIGRPAGRRRLLSRASEPAVVALIYACGAFSIAVTLAIVFILITESLRFFTIEGVSLVEFLTGLKWEPLLGADKKFGVLPLASATIAVSAIAMAVAIPLGLITAIYLSEFAHPRVAAILKPIIEVLAGIPTVVYGFFALTTITPALRLLSGDFEFFNITSAGLAVGVMTLPTVSSLSEDALRAVPRGLREGAFGLGATRFDVAVKVVTPAALSGVIAAFLLAIARAVGETMIVALAAGGLARLALDPTQGAQTMTAYMVQIFLGDAEFGSVEYYSSYAVGAMLFAMTLALTVAGGWILKRFREVYD